MAIVIATRLSGIYYIVAKLTIYAALRQYGRIASLVELEQMTEQLVLVLEYPSTGWPYSHLWLLNPLPEDFPGYQVRHASEVLPLLDLASGTAKLIRSMSGARYLRAIATRLHVPPRVITIEYNSDEIYHIEDGIILH